MNTAPSEIMEVPDELRSKATILRDLIDKLEERTWVHSYERCPRGCCGEWSTKCTECGADEGDYADKAEYRIHKPGCQLEALIKEAKSLLQIQEFIEDDS